jgi:hypothetical protein
VGPYASGEVPTPEIPRVGALAFGARVRQRSTPFSVVSEIDRRVREAHGRRDALDASIASGVAPVDWAAWTRTAMQVEEELHIGTSGYVDESYFRTILEFMSRQRAPRDAVTTVAFVHDLASWNLPKASREADTLIALTLGGQERLPPEMLLDGAVAAKLLSGDKLGAERTLRALLGRTPRGPDDLRTRLVVSHLRMANPAPSGPRRE